MKEVKFTNDNFSVIVNYSSENDSELILKSFNVTGSKLECAFENKTDDSVSVYFADVCYHDMMATHKEINRTLWLGDSLTLTWDSDLFKFLKQ